MIYNFFGIEVNYIIIKAEKNNDKPPILFLHGWGGEVRSFSAYAQKIKNRDCILVDFPPFGKSGQVIFPLSTKLYAKMIVGLIKSLKIDAVSIVAHSFGGRVAIEMSKIGLNIDKMLLTGCAGIKKRSMVSCFKIVKYKVVKFLCKIHILKPEILKQFGSSDYKNLNNIMKQTFNNIISYDQTKDLKKINCPVVLFWGKNDKDTPFYFTKIFKKHIKDCGVVSTNGGHFAYLQSPSLFLEVMFAFFDIKREK